MSPGGKLRLFEGFGIELEYMIVSAAGLDVLPVCDEVLRAVAGEYVSDVEQGDLHWSNEVVLHVIELKTGGPVPDLAGVAALFQRDVGRIGALLEGLGGRLMPTAMHPWMDPALETRLWPHEYSPVYEAFDRIFGCRGHGWSNLQSAHLNLPFADDGEFSRLHAAVRLVLPILPAIAASSPLADGRLTGLLDTRLRMYRDNARRIPSVTGGVIPEPAWSRAEYETVILEPLYRDVAPCDPQGVLRHEWLNARGAIARFERHTIEIRLIDMQECPAADLAVAAAGAAVVRALVAERWTAHSRQRAFGVEELAAVLEATTRDAENAVIADREYLEVFGCRERSCRAGALWRRVLSELGLLDAGCEWREALGTILGRGTLATRIARAAGTDPSRERLMGIYRRLCECLAGGVTFAGEGDHGGG